MNELPATKSSYVFDLIAQFLLSLFFNPQISVLFLYVPDSGLQFSFTSSYLLLSLIYQNLGEFAYLKMVFVFDIYDDTSSKVFPAWSLERIQRIFFGWNS